MNEREFDLRPLGSRVVVRPITRTERTVTGIHLPETTQKASQRGQVIAVGPGDWDRDMTRRIKPDVAVGDVVLFQKYAGNEAQFGVVPDGEKDLLVLSEREILAVITYAGVGTDADLTRAINEPSRLREPEVVAS